jgi:hypothetical protein
MPEKTTVPLVAHAVDHGLYIKDHTSAVLVQRVAPDGRAFIHPIYAPDGAGPVTEDAPAHHPWQHGLYIGLNDVNGVGFWHEGLHPTESADDGTISSRLGGYACHEDGRVVWDVLSDYSDRSGACLLREVQSWQAVRRDSSLILDLRWTLLAVRPITFGQYEYGGLFLRVPYRADVGGVAVDSEGQSASGRRARWVTVALALPETGRVAHVAILDHPDNPGSPVSWRIDNELGIGPSPSAEGAWTLAEGASVVFRYRVSVSGSPVPATKQTDRQWFEFVEGAS